MQNLQKYDNVWIGTVAAILGFSAVALGAFGAHMLKGVVSVERIATWQTATDYQMYHALALLFIFVLSQKVSRSLLRHSAKFISAGTVVFSGSLYTLVLTNIGWFGAITPIGGVLILIGWLLLIADFIRTTP